MVRQPARGRVLAGESTVTYRLWARAQVKAGNVYDSPGVGRILVEELDAIPAAMVPPADVALAGCATMAEVWASAGDHKGVPVAPDTLLHRVGFRVLR
jgi:hypothetical protein